MQEFVLQLSSCCFLELFCDWARQTHFFSLLLRLICFLPNGTSQLKILHSYAEGKYCQYSPHWSLCYEEKKEIFYESLVVMLFEFLILLDAGPWQVSLIRFWFDFQGHLTVRFGRYLFGRPKIEWDFRISLQWKLEISSAKHHVGLP